MNGSACDTCPNESELCDAIAEAAEKAITSLFNQHPGRYYYLSLITTGEAHPPVLAAWSEEALERAVNDADDKEEASWNLKWSYADSPFFCFGEDYFARVIETFALRPDIQKLGDDEWRDEYDLRLRAMESAVAALDRRGIFGRGEERNRIVVNVEVMPPDFTNTLRAMRLNPPAAVRDWLAEAAESI